MTFYTAMLSISGFCLTSGTQYLAIPENSYFLFFPELKVSSEKNFYSRDAVQCVEIDFKPLSVERDWSSCLH